MIVVLGITQTLGSIPAGWLAFAGTITGGIGLKLLEKFLNRGAEKRMEQDGLRTQIAQLQSRLDALEEDISEWRTRAFGAEEQVALLRQLIINSGGKLPEDVCDKR